MGNERYLEEPDVRPDGESCAKCYTPSFESDDYCRHCGWHLRAATISENPTFVVVCAWCDGPVLNVTANKDEATGDCADCGERVTVHA